MTGKKCKNEACSNEATSYSAYCRECYLERKRMLFKQRYHEKGRYMYKNICIACGKMFDSFRKESRFCSDCRKKSYNTGFIYNGYEVAGGGGYSFKHRKIAESILHRKLSTNEVVHHINCDETDNNIDNLIVISRSKHGKLHQFLREQRVIMEKSIRENFENCWKNLIRPITKAWLETTNVKVEKLWEVSQSAAEPLNEKSHEEGSETMHEAPEKGDDIVQTTT